MINTSHLQLFIMCPQQYLYRRTLFHICETMNHLPVSAKKLTEDLGYILGVVCGDAHIGKYNIFLHVKDKDFAEIFAATLKRWSGFHVSLTTSNYVRVQMSSIEAVTFLKQFNYTKLKSAPIGVKTAFLKGMYDSEGSVNKQLHNRVIVLSNTEKNLLKLCKSLLRSLGIKARPIRISTKKGSVVRFPNGTTYVTKKPCYGFHICGKENLKKFSTLINFNVGWKKERLSNRLESYLTKDEQHFLNQLSSLKRPNWRMLYDKEMAL